MLTIPTVIPTNGAYRNIQHATRPYTLHALSQITRFCTRPQARSFLLTGGLKRSTRVVYNIPHSAESGGFFVDNLQKGAISWNRFHTRPRTLFVRLAELVATFSRSGATPRQKTLLKYVIDRVVIGRDGCETPYRVDVGALSGKPGMLPLEWMNAGT